MEKDKVEKKCGWFDYIHSVNLQCKFCMCYSTVKKCVMCDIFDIHTKCNAMKCVMGTGRWWYLDIHHHFNILSSLGQGCIHHS